MKRLVAVIAVGMLGLLPAYAQHGRATGAGGQAMAHTHIGQGKSNASHGTTTTGGVKKSPSDLLAQNQKLSAKLQSLLPQGTTPQDACSGFKNLGQCVAAVHVSHNLDLSFTDLKAKMLGTTSGTSTAGTKPMSLGSAIQTLDPKADAKAETTKANKQAKNDLAGTA